MVRATIVLALILIGIRAPVTAATQQHAPADAEPAPDGPGITAAEIQRLYDAYALVQAQEALQLRDDHYPRFVARLKTLQEMRRRHMVARNRILQDLRRLTAAETPDADDAEVRERLKALRDEDERGAAEMRKAYEAVDELLDVRQQAKFRLFEEQMDRKRLDLLMRARQNVRGRR